MERMTMQEIAQAVGAQGLWDGAIEQISTDSREIPQGCLFVALAGERFNGHDYIVQAFEQGAAYVLAHEHRDYGGYSNRVLYTEDTERGLMEIGGAYRERFDLCCIGITGSVGKTTTKDMIAEVVSAGYRTLKTQGNLNNEIGLPKTLLGLDRSYQAAVIEMGMQGLGEIAALARIARPQIGVITNIGVSHLEQLGTRENILRAKLELAEALPDGAPLILCGDDDLLRDVSMPRLRVIRYGIENDQCDIRAQEICEGENRTVFTFLQDAARFRAEIPCIGAHNVRNALAAFAVGRVLGLDAQSCIAALAGYSPSGMRQKMVSYHGYTVVEDCYNASPDSMRAALITLAAYRCSGRRIAVLADMLELGALAQQAHTEIGLFAAQQGIDLLLGYGALSGFCCAGAAQGGIEAMHFIDKDDLSKRLKAYLRAGDVVWFKGSRGMRLEEILQGLYDKETTNQ